MVVVYQMSALVGRNTGVLSYGEGEDEFMDLPRSGWIDDWSPPVLTMGLGYYADYMVQLGVLRVGCACSEKMRRVIDLVRSPLDRIQWLPVIARAAREERTYYLLHFIEIPDLLNWDASIKSPDGSIVKPVFSRAKLGGHRIFTALNSRFNEHYVTPEVKDAIEGAKCTGVQFFAATAR